MNRPDRRQLFVTRTTFVVAMLTALTVHSAEYETGIRNRSIIDGSGQPRFIADIGIDQRIIIEIGNLQKEVGKAEINDRGKIVSQGFINVMGQTPGNQIASHLRSHGSSPDVIRTKVREQHARSLEQETPKASKRLVADQCGELKPAQAADVIVFDETQLGDPTDLKSPSPSTDGIDYVLVNGKTAYQNGRDKGNRSGVFLKDTGVKKRPKPIHLARPANAERFVEANATVLAFLEKHQIPGAAIAVTEAGKLVHSAGYGYADLAEQKPVQPTSLFRIASISKPITAVAILQLVEKNMIHLDDFVYEKLGLLDTASPSSQDSRLRDITVEHLLEHRGGWDRDQSFDPMFQSVRFAEQLGIPSPVGSNDVIKAMMPQTLDFDPGQRYAYSNFGYCLLGRLIEKVTAQTYEQYVHENVLAPLGIRAMRLGKTKFTERSPNEVRYYHPHSAESIFEGSRGEQVPSPYGGWYLEAMDSHGGWIASAEDLVRFASAFDDPSNCPILSSESIARMYQRPAGIAGYDEEGNPKDVYYSLGWSNRSLADGKMNHWHSGSLPGTAAIMIRRHDGKNFVGLLNTRVSPNSQSLGLELDRLLHRVVDMSCETTDQQ